MKYDIYMSYTATDKQIADKLFEIFSCYSITYQEGINKSEDRVDLNNIATKAIEESDIMIFLSSYESNKSPLTMIEIVTAFNKQRPIISFKTQNVPLPDHLQPFLSLDNCIDISEDMEQSAEELVDAILDKLGREKIKQQSEFDTDTYSQELEEQRVFDLNLCKEAGAIFDDNDTILVRYKNVTHVNIPYGVKIIGEGAFKWEYNLESVVIPDTVYAIGDRSFESTSLKSITIPDSVIHIGKCAFRDCHKLEKVVIGKSVVDIDQSSFSGRNNLDEIENHSSHYILRQNGLYNKYNNKIIIKLVHKPNNADSITDGVTILDSSMLDKQIVNLVIPPSVVNIEPGALQGYTNLESVEIKSPIKTINSNTFKGCHKLTKIVIPNSVYSIEDNAFFDCTSLESIDLSSNLRSIGANAFEGCTSLQSISIPSSTQNIGKRAFANCKNLLNVTIAGSIRLIEEEVFVNCCSLNSFIAPETVTKIEKSAFRECHKLEDIYIPSLVASICDSAFYNCCNLKALDLPDKLYLIGVSAFERCAKLRSISMPTSTRNIGSRAFANCVNLSSVSILGSTTSIEPYLFYQCFNLKTIIIPDTVKNISEKAFFNCYNLTDIDLPDTLEYVNPSAFERCIMLQSKLPKNIVEQPLDNRYNIEPDTIVESVQFVNSLDSADDIYRDELEDDPSDIEYNEVFSPDKKILIEAANVKQYVIPDTVEVIRRTAFRNCEKLKSVTISSSVKSIGELAFEKCINLIEVKVDGDKFHYEEGILYTKSKTTIITAFPNIIPAKIVLPSTVKRIKSCAFSYCSRMVSITLPDTLIFIDEFAFMHCYGLQYIDIPDSVKDIFEGTFLECRKLSEVHLSCNVELIDDNAFTGCSNLESIHLPKSVMSCHNDAFNYCDKLSMITVLSGSYVCEKLKYKYGDIVTEY